MEEIELYITKNEIITIGDKLIDSEDIFQLSNKIKNTKVYQCIDTILECIFHMPVKIGIYATILGIITKNNEKLKTQLISKLNHNIEVFVKKNFLQCLLWCRCIIGLGCCGVYDFDYCLDFLKKLLELSIETYNENQFVKADNILYILLSNFFYISKQKYDSNKNELDLLLNSSFELIEKRQRCIDNIDLESDDISIIEYIYIYINGVIHSNNFYDRLFYLKDALKCYLDNNLKSVATHRFYQKEIFQNIFLKKQKEDINDSKSYEKDDDKKNILINNTNGINNEKNDNDDDEILLDDIHDVIEEIGGSVEKKKENITEDSLKGIPKKELAVMDCIKECLNVKHFLKYDCEEFISSLQIIFHTKYANSNNIHDIWLIQEHILHIIELYKDSSEFCSKVLGVYVQLQSKMYNNVLIEVIINKLLASFNDSNYYFYISLIHRLLLINKNLGSVVIRCVKFIINKNLDLLDNESFYLFMELCLYLLSHFLFENKLARNKEIFFKRKYNDMNKILQVKNDNVNQSNQSNINIEQNKEFGNTFTSNDLKGVSSGIGSGISSGISSGINSGINSVIDSGINSGIDNVMSENLLLDKQMAVIIGENDNIKNENLGSVKKNVILTKNESTLNKMKSHELKVPYCLDIDIKYSSDEEDIDDEKKEEERKKEEVNLESKINRNTNDGYGEDEDVDYDDEEGDERNDINHHNNDSDNLYDEENNEYSNFDCSIFIEELQKMNMTKNLKRFTSLMYNVKKKHHRKWVKNFYFKSFSLVYKNDTNDLIPKSVIDYCNSFICVKDKSHEQLYEYMIFQIILKYTLNEVNDMEDKYIDMSNSKKKNYDNYSSNKRTNFTIDTVNNNNVLYNSNSSDNMNNENAINEFKTVINELIENFLQYLDTKMYLNKIPMFFNNLSQNVYLLKEYNNNRNINKLNVFFFDSYIYPNDFLIKSEKWDSHNILILLFKAMIFFGESNVSDLEKIFKTHAVIFHNYKNSSYNMRSDDAKKEFDIDLIKTVYNYFNNSILFNVIVNILLKNKIMDEFSVISYIFDIMSDSSLDECYVQKLIYEIVKNLITEKDQNDLKKNNLKRKQTKNENEQLIKELDDKNQELNNKIFHLTNETIMMFSKKMMQLKNESNSYMSKEMLKELLVYMRTFGKYIDIDNFMQSCQDYSFASELMELGTVFKYASLKKKAV
ncbi:conserved protein, unknown function [Hepatocystis sp. ex Piliocolobus tephrosceles]|nr:conserved protein, unknown function [Hepatocystis sp. ex Piliocolobus tephrosceles]